MVSSSRSTLLVLIFKSPGWLSRQGTLFYQLPFEPGHLFINLTSSICLITLMPNDDCSSKDLLFLLEEIWAYLSGSKYFADLVINVCLDKFSLRKGVWVINESILTFFFKSADIFFWFKWSKSYSALSGNSQPDLLRRQHRSHRPFLPPPHRPLPLASLRPPATQKGLSQRPLSLPASMGNPLADHASFCLINLSSHSVHETRALVTEVPVS